MPVEHSAVMSTRRSRGLSDITPQFPAKGTGSVRLRRSSRSGQEEEETARFPRLDQCAHFHYDLVDLPPLQVSLCHDQMKPVGGDLSTVRWFAVQVRSHGVTWLLRRTYDNFRLLDQQIHRCVYDRKFSDLPELAETEPEEVADTLERYLERFSSIAGNLVACGPVLNWLELDNRGRRLLVPDTDNCPINTPAVAAAYAVRRYSAQAGDEISFEVGDMISVIDMPPPAESVWWRGKRGFQVGFFPGQNVAVIGDKVPRSLVLPPTVSGPVPAPAAAPAANVAVANISLPSTSASTSEPSKPVLRKHGKLIAFFRSFILARPSRRRLKQSGILKERVFGCDLGEHLLNSGHQVPMVLKCCAEFIESNGIVDGIYRLSGVTSNIQKLRNAFDEDRVPALYEDEAILQDIHSVASLLKMYFRELPNPLCTYQLYHAFVSAVGARQERRLAEMRAAVSRLPPPHHRTLEYLMRHLARVAARGHATGMTARNVAIVWAPNLLRCKELEVGGVAALQGVGIQAVVTEFLVCYADLIFCDNVAALTLPPIASPKRCRPKSLAISTPTKLLTLEEARTRALGSKPDTDYIEVGGGPSQLPAKYHTVIELPRKRGAAAKRSPLGWKSLFGKSGRKNSMRKASAPSDLGLEQPAMTECDLAAVNRRRLRPIKSAESLSSANSSSRNSALVEGAEAEEARQEVAQRNNGHSRSVSHDSYFDVLDTPEHVRPTARPSRLLELDNEDSSLDLSEIQLNFDLEDSEMRIFSEDETLVSASYGSGSLGNSPRAKAALRPRQPRALPAETLSPRRPKNSCSSVSPTESSRSKRSRLEEQLASSAGELRFIDSQSPDNSVTTRAEVHPTSGQSSDSDAPVALYKSLVDRDSTCSTSASLSPGPCQQSFSNDLLSSIFSNTLLSETSNDCTNDCTPSDEFLSPRNQTQQTQENAYKTLTEIFSPEIEAAESPSIESKSSPELCLIEKVAAAESSLRESRLFNETRAIVEESLAVSRSPSNSQSLMPSEASGTQMSQSSSLDIPYNRFNAPSPDSSGNATPTLSESGTHTPENQLVGRSTAVCVSQSSTDLLPRPMETHIDGAQLKSETQSELEIMPELNVAVDERNESNAVGFVEERRPSHEYQNISFSQETPCKAYENVPMTLSFRESAYENVAPLVFTGFSPATSPVKESLITIKYGNVTSPKRKDWDGGKVDALLDGVYQNVPREENVYENVEMKPSEGSPEIIYQQVKYLRRSVHEVNKLLVEEPVPRVSTQEIGQQEVSACHVPDLIQLESPVDNPNIHRELCNSELLATNQLSCSKDISPPQEISLLDREVCVSDLASLQVASLDQPHNNIQFGIMAATTQEDPQSFSELATTLSTSSKEHDDISEITTMQLAPLEKPQEVVEVAIMSSTPLDQPKINELPAKMASSYSPVEELCTREDSSAKIAFASFDQRQASGEDFKFPEEQAECDLESATENTASSCLESGPLIDLLVSEDNHESLNSKSPAVMIEYSAPTVLDDRGNVPVSLERHRNVREVSHREKEESLEEFLSDTELTRRRFESEIGRDMIRERRMKLELEESGRKAAGIRALVNKFEASSPTKEVADIWPPKKHEPTEPEPAPDKDMELAACKSPTRRKSKGDAEPLGSGEETPTSPEPRRPGAWNDSEPVPPCIRARKNRARQQSQLSASLDGDTFPEAEGKAATRTQTSPDVSAPGSVLKPLNECHDEAQRRARIEKYKEERRTFLREKFRAPEVVPTPRVRADSLKGDRKLGKAIDDVGDAKTCRSDSIDKYSSLDRTVLKSTPSKESRFKNPEASQLECAILSSNKMASESLAKKAGGQVTCVKVTTRNAPDKYNVTMGWKGKETERSKHNTSPSKVVITSSVTSPTRRNPLEKDRRRLDSGATDVDRRSPGTTGKKTGKTEAAEIRSPKSGDGKSWKRPSSIETPASSIVLDTGSRRKSSGSPSYCIRDMAAMFEGRDNSSAKSATPGKQCHLSSV